MSCIILTYSCCCACRTVCCKAVGCICPIMVDCSNVFNILCLGCCPIIIECCCVGCGSLFRAGCCDLFCRSDGSFSSFYMICIILTYSCCSASGAVFCEAVFNRPCVVDCCNIINILGLGFCPVNIECCSVGGCTNTFAGCGSLDCRGDGCIYSYVVFCIVCTNTSCCAGLAVCCEAVFNRPCVVDCRNILNIKSLYICPFFFECCSVGCPSLYCAGCSFLHCRSDLCGCIFNMICIILTYSCCCACRTVCCKAVGFICPVVVDCRNILNIKSLYICPIFFECCSVDCPSLYCAGCGSLDCRGDGCIYSYIVRCIVCTSSGCSTGLAVCCKAVFNRPCVTEFVAICCLTFCTGLCDGTGCIVPSMFGNTVSITGIAHMVAVTVCIDMLFRSEFSIYGNVFGNICKYGIPFAEFIVVGCIGCLGGIFGSSCVLTADNRFSLDNNVVCHECYSVSVKRCSMFVEGINKLFGFLIKRILFGFDHILGNLISNFKNFIDSSLGFISQVGIKKTCKLVVSLFKCVIVSSYNCFIRCMT